MAPTLPTVLDDGGEEGLVFLPTTGSVASRAFVPPPLTLPLHKADLFTLLPADLSLAGMASTGGRGCLDGSLSPSTIPIPCFNLPGFPGTGGFTVLVLSDKPDYTDLVATTPDSGFLLTEVG